MVRNRNDKKILSATEIFDRLGVGYYEILIDECETRIMNIRSGKGDTLGDYTYRSDESFKNQAEKERKIDSLRKQIQKYREIIKEISNAINAVDRNLYVLEKAAKKQALIGSLSESLRTCFLKYETKGEERVRIPSDTYDAIFKNKFFDNFRSKYRRLWSKEYNNATKVTRKVKKDVYNKLKKIANRNVVLDDDRHYSYSYRTHDRYEYSSLNGTLTENYHTLSGFAYDLYSDMLQKYNYHRDDNLTELGVETDKLNRAIRISDGEDRLFEEYKDILKSMEYLSSNYNVYSRFRTFSILREKIEVVDKLSREVECLDLIIDAYDNTEINDTDLFKELIEIYRKQNKKLNDLSRKVDELYEKSGIKEYLELEQKLRDLYNRANRLRGEINRLESQPNYNYQEAQKLRDLYIGARSEMLSIVIKYPELNKYEYNIDLEKYDRKGRYRGKDEEDIGLDRTDKRVPREDSATPTRVVADDEPIIPTRVVTEEELREDLGMTDDKPKKGWETVDTPEEEVELEIPEDLRAFRTAHYNRYMNEKVRGTEYGKMSFSEYLEAVAPELEDLIKIEKARESKAKNVFASYILYRASLKDKSQAMRFSEFARFRHGLDPDELPYEYSDEEVKKRLG